MATSDLPQEILIEIFSWLPVKSVGNCRCLAKSWRTLLSTPQFIESHLTRRRGQENLIITTSSHTTHSIKDDAVYRKLEFPVGSCDGLVLLVNNDCEMFLVNPVTLRQVRIPDSILDSTPPIEREYSFRTYGLGYDRFSSDYKIVEISYNVFRPDRLDVDVYSVKRGIWKRVHNSPYDHSTVALDPGAFVNGAIHWLASIRGSGYTYVIAAFNLVDEVFDDIPVPVDAQKFVSSCHLVVLGGCLCMFETRSCMFETRNDCQINFWVMKEYGVRESWTKFSIHADCGWDFMKPLQFIGDENVVLLTGWHSLVVYNLKERTLSDMFVDGVVDATTFVESLVSPPEEACYN